MRMVFLLGGAGNVYFQLLEMEKNGFNFAYSDILINKVVRKVLRHTDHAPIYEELFTMPQRRNFLGVLLLPLVVIDYILSKLFGLSFFTTFDLRSIKNRSPIFSLIWIGYFQDAVKLSDMKKYNILKPIAVNDGLLNVMHIRGGDFIHYEGALGVDYYEQAIKYADFSGNDITIVTDDIAFSKEMVGQLSLDRFNVSIISEDSISDFQKIASATRIVSSNSTFALVASISSPALEKAVYPDSLIQKFILDDDMSQFIDVV